MQKKIQKESKIRKEINQFYEENELANLKSNKNRARSFSVGTAFGGIIEVSMRGDYHNLWCLLQPVEAVEFIEQLAAAAGLQVAIRPRQDFASWRGWNIDTDKKYWVGAAHWQLGEDDPAEKKSLIGKEDPKKLPAGEVEVSSQIKKPRKTKKRVVKEEPIDE